MFWLYLKAVFGLGLVTLSAFGAGAWIALILPPTYRKFERLALALLGGLGILSSAIFLVGQVLLTPFSIGCTLAVGIILAFASFHKVFATGVHIGTLRSVPKFPAVIIGSLLVITAISGLAEETGDWNDDAVAYHLLGPKVWLREGRIRPVLDNCHTAFPQVPETLFAILWSVGGSRAPNFSSFLTFGLLLALSGSIATRCGLGDFEAWWVAAIVSTMPAVYAGAHGCFVDAIFAAFVIAATRVGLDVQHSSEWSILGLFCGLALGTKYTALLAVPAVLMCVLLLPLKRGNWNAPSLAKKIFLAGGIAFLIGSPYYIRNWLLLGCPIYPPPPGYAAWCSPKYLTPDSISQFHAYIRQRGIGLGRGLSAFLHLPFNITFHTSNFHGAGGIGLCPLALGPIGLISFRNDRVVKFLTVLSLILISAWFATQQESRFLIHVYVFGAVFAVLGWHSVRGMASKLSKYLTVAVLLISFSYGYFMIAKENLGAVRSVFLPRYAMLRHESIPYDASFEYLNNHDSVRKVLILDQSVPALYSDKSYLKPVGQWGERTLPGGPDSSETLRRALAHQLNVTDVLDVRSELSGFQIRPGTTGLTLVFEAENQRIYRVD